MDDLLPWVVLTVIVLALGGLSKCSYDSGHDKGVRDALAGKYTVVELPDGTSVVVKVAKEPNP